MVSSHHACDGGERVFGSDTGGEWCRDSAKKGAAQASLSEHSGAFQGAPQSPVRLSCAEIRHLFCQLVLAVERSAEMLLQWYSCRRWHQAGARWYHYRELAAGEVESVGALAEKEKQEQQVRETKE